MVSRKLVSKMFEANGRIVGATFFKRTTGELRVMSCRLGVRKYVNGDGLKFNAMSKELLTVFDMNKRSYRMLNLRGLVSVRSNGRVYVSDSLNCFAVRV